MAAPFKGA